MQFTNSHIFHWIHNIPYRGIERAYKASKKIKSVQILYEKCTNKSTLKYSLHNMFLYINAVLDEASFEIYRGLFEFQLGTFLVNIFNKIYWPQYFSQKAYTNSQKLDIVKKKMIWIEATLVDLKYLKNRCSIPSISFQTQTKKTQKLNSNFLKLTTQKNITYESVGLVPRSITRTLSRFQIELAGRSVSLVIPEFQLAKYQVTTSLQFLFFLIVFPWIISSVCKMLFFQPLIEHVWNTKQHQIFLNSLQEETALKRLQEIEELLWLDIVINNKSNTYLQNFAFDIQQKTNLLVNEYNLNSIQILLHLLTNLLSFILIIFILIWGKKRLTIFNSWIQELFYSLSDTMKSFFILLLTDLCIGFHSPHGWEIAISFLLEYLGFSHNKHLISCFVSTFPVILDTVFKYWIFRHLNRISPSIVVTYHTMNE